MVSMIIMPLSVSPSGRPRKALYSINHHPACPCRIWGNANAHFATPLFADVLLLACLPHMLDTRLRLAQVSSASIITAVLPPEFFQGGHISFFSTKGHAIICFPV